MAAHAQSTLVIDISEVATLIAGLPARVVRR
jgi:hypothetical protein